MLAAAVLGRGLATCRGAGVMVFCTGLRRPIDDARDTARFAGGLCVCFAVAVFGAAFFFEFAAAAFGALLRLRPAAGFFVLPAPFPVRFAMFALHKSHQKHATVPILIFA